MILNANALHIPLADGTIQTCVTSPPYYGLRDYQIDGQLGLEQTPQEYIDNMVAVFREVWRVLRDDGTLWLNLGDSYAGGNGNGGAGPASSKQVSNHGSYFAETVKSKRMERGSGRWGGGDKKVDGLQAKQLLGMPWRTALALQADGWYLRSDIIWHKPNPMPESVTDRPTKAHEYIFLLTKSARYYYDAEAVKEESVTPAGGRVDIEGELRVLNHDLGIRNGRAGTPEGGRNKRTVWTVATQPYPGAHFATFPPKLIEPCILAGTSAKGQCPKCGAAWERDVRRVSNYEKRETAHAPNSEPSKVDSTGWKPPTTTDRGFRPACTCDAGEPVPQIVLDPFSGSGTTGRVAIQHGRRYVGLELNPEYIKLAPDRMTVQVNLI